MRGKYSLLNRSLRVILLIILGQGALAGDQARLDQLFERLQTRELPDWEAVEQEIWDEWSKSGSDAMDLLLSRGRDAMEKDDMIAAIEHLTALTDHAPDFAEGFHMRATAYFRVGKLGPSIADLERALALNPRHFGAMSGLGTVLIELGRDREALKVLHMAIELNPHRPDFQNQIRYLEAQSGAFDI